MEDQVLEIHLMQDQIMEMEMDTVDQIMVIHHMEDQVMETFLMEGQCMETFQMETAVDHLVGQNYGDCLNIHIIQTINLFYIIVLFDKKLMNL